MKVNDKDHIMIKKVEKKIDVKGSDGDVYWSVLWCKNTQKKNKVYSDGFLHVVGTTTILYDGDKKRIGKSFESESVISSIKEDETIKICGKELKFMEIISKEDFDKDDSELYIKKEKKSEDDKEKEKVKSNTFVHPTRVRKTSLYNPDDPNAIILFTPPEGSEDKVHIVVDPILTRKLRPHQVEGVTFMYQCIMGLRNENFYGCILADEIGLGKSLQALTVMWTCIKQSPNVGFVTAGKVLIICPTTLVKNWGKELSKWIGNDRIEYHLIGMETKKQAQEKLEQFSDLKYKILVVSYEKCRIHIDLITKINFGLLIIDEGHRLSNSENKTYEALYSLPCKRRIILSGTPYQNNMKEFHSLIDFCNPGIFGTYADFRQQYENPITHNNNKMYLK